MDEQRSVGGGMDTHKDLHFAAVVEVYSTRDEARQDVFDYIEMFYNPKRRHSFNERLSPVEFEKRHILRLQSI